VVTTIYVISHENVFCVRDLPPDSKELKKIKILAMNITANGDWAIHRRYIFLLRQDLACLFTEGLYFQLSELILAI
jgi:hypothetical protein